MENKNDEKLFAGKFKTVEELEAGYKNSLPTFQENEALKRQVTELTSVPESYLNPDDVQIEESRINDIKARAKEAGLTQAQYDKMLRGDKTRVENNKQNFEKVKKELGDETINILKDYVAKNYPKELHENMVNTFIGNKDARQAALNHRDLLLNNQIPGMNKVSTGGYTVTRDDVLKARDAVEKARGKDKEAAKAHYINILSAQAAQRAS